MEILFRSYYKQAIDICSNVIDGRVGGYQMGGLCFHDGWSRSWGCWDCWSFSRSSWCWAFGLFNNLRLRFCLSLLLSQSASCCSDLFFLFFSSESLLGRVSDFSLLLIPHSHNLGMDGARDAVLNLQIELRQSIL